MIKKIFEKYIGQLLVMATVLGIGFFAYSAYRDATEKRKYADLIGTKEKYEQLTKYTAKLESDYQGQKDLHKRAKRDWAEVSRSKDERIKLLSDATYLIGKHVQKQDGPDYYFQTKRGTRNYVLNELRIAGEDSPPIGYILIKHDGRTYKRNYEFEIHVKNLQTIDEKTGRVKVYSKAYFIAKENGLAKKRRPDLKKWKDVPYPLPIVDGVAYIDPTRPDVRERFLLWAPHINGGFNVGANISGAFMRPAINFSTSGYGKSRNDLTWKFVHLGFDVDTDFAEPGLHLMPFSYRPFPSILTNTYIGPGMGWTKSGVNYFFNVNLSF